MFNFLKQIKDSIVNFIFEKLLRVIEALGRYI
jgi:hypothetical protein